MMVRRLFVRAQKEKVKAGMEFVDLSPMFGRK